MNKRMKKNYDWLLEIVICPECGHTLTPGNSENNLLCTHKNCGYQAERKGRIIDLLPRKLDRFQKAENAFRVKRIEKWENSAGTLPAVNLFTHNMLNIITFFAFTGQYFFFRDYFFKKYHLKGKGLELGAGTGQLSGFVKLFFPETTMIASDVAPVNLTLAKELAQFVGFETDFFIGADAERLPFSPGSFDYIISSGMLHHLSDIRKGLKRGHAVLKPGGIWYVINELSIHHWLRLYWSSRWGKKGKLGRTKGIHEKSYTLKEWKSFFKSENFKIVETYFPRNSKHKLRSWSRSTYYAFISKLPLSIIEMGIPCEVNFVLEKI